MFRRLAIHRGADVDTVDDTFHGWTALHFAADKGHAAVVELLLYYGAAVERRETSSNATALHLAAHNGRRRVCELLISKGADCRATSAFDVTPLLLAQSKGWLSGPHAETAGLLVPDREGG